jgi:hypothetical protein
LIIKIWVLSTGTQYPVVSVRARIKLRIIPVVSVRARIKLRIIPDGIMCILQWPHLVVEYPLLGCLLLNPIVLNTTTTLERGSYANLLAQWLETHTVLKY